jgi:Flp pilus assembly protein CpaB
MKPKTMILMGLAITCGLGASYMTSRLLADRQTEEKETVEVLVAKRSLSVGERLTKPEELFEKKTILKENDTPDAIRDFDAALRVCPACPFAVTGRASASSGKECR